MDQRRATQADVARVAGVSRSLVSRVLQGLDKVSDEKRERVLAAAKEVGYIDNGLATALAGNRSGKVLGLLLQELSNALFAAVYDAVKVVLEPHGYRLVVVEGSLDPEEEDHRLRQLVSYAPDCLLLAGYAGSTDALGAAVHSLPIVSVTRHIQEQGVWSVFNDDHAGATLATQHLLDLGHTRIAHLQLPPDIPYQDRAAGYADTMRAAGLEPRLVAPRDLSRASAHRAVQALMTHDDPPTAIFCGSDHMALGALDALEGLGLSVPGDLSVVGYDNQPLAHVAGLTTVDQGVAEQGRVAARFVRALVEQAEPELDEDGAPLRQRVISPALVTRRTSAAPRP